jgi:subtilase family serine protease
VSGSPTDINKAFAVKMQVHQRTAQTGKYYAPDVEPSAISSLPILSVEGLSTRDLPHPMLVHAATVHSDTTGSGQSGQFLGSDIRAAYAPGVTLDGEGQTVGLVELGPYNLSDVQMYFTAVNQPLKVPIYNVLLDVDGICSGTPSSEGCDDGEEVIDIQQAISMAPGLSGLIVYEAYGSGSDALTAFAQAASDDTAKQLSLSFGFGGTPATQPGYEQVFMELAAQGQNLFIASGDSGANVGDVGYPGNSPNVTDVGGTDLTTAGAGGPWAFRDSMDRQRRGLEHSVSDSLLSGSGNHQQQPGVAELPQYPRCRHGSEYR